MRKVLITGGSKGIGKSMTFKFLETGYQVFAVARKFEDMPDAENLVKIEFDLNKSENLNQIIETTGSIDILINNAGIMTGNTIHDYSTGDRENMLNVNLISAIELIRLYIGTMMTEGFGRIINISSTAGKTGHPDIWYGITKAGLINLTATLSKRHKGSGVTVNVILPGPVDTKMMRTVPEERKVKLREIISLAGPLVQPEDIAKTALWLASDEASAINGQSIEIDNGVIWK